MDPLPLSADERMQAEAAVLASLAVLEPLLARLMATPADLATIRVRCRAALGHTPHWRHGHPWEGLFSPAGKGIDEALRRGFAGADAAFDAFMRLARRELRAMANPPVAREAAILRFFNAFWYDADFRRRVEAALERHGIVAGDVLRLDVAAYDEWLEAAFAVDAAVDGNFARGAREEVPADCRLDAWDWDVISRFREADEAPLALLDPGRGLSETFDLRQKLRSFEAMARQVPADVVTRLLEEAPAQAGGGMTSTGEGNRRRPE